MRSRQPVLTAALAVLLTAGLAVATAAPAAATTAPPGATPPPGAAAAAEADEQAPPRAAGEEAQQRQLAFSDRPENVRVDVDSSGYVVYGTPVCTGLVWGCTTRILKDNVWSARLNTQAGYRVSWPADWKEGESRELGKLYTVVKDWIAWWWAPAKGVSLGSITRPYATRSLTAAVESKDDAARTATLSGTATPGATITVQSVSVGTVPSSGRWSTTVRNLSVGTNQRLVQQVIDGKVHDAKVLTIEIAEPDRPLTATVESVDPAARTAELEGTAPSAAGSVDVSWMRSGKSETKTVRVVDGHWSTRVDGLAAGANPVHVEAFDGGESLGTADVDVTVEVPPFAATVAFDDDVAKDAVIRGTGTPGAQVVIRDGSTAIGSSEVADDGSWSVSTAAPDRGGVRQVVATQTIDGQGTGRVTLDVDYGAAVRITSPGDGFVPSPAFPSVRVVGQAQPGVVVHLSVRGGRELGTATADADGRWAVSTGALRESERTLDASGTSKGANTTTDDLVLGGS